MNSISERDSLPVRCRVACEGMSRCASQSSNTLQKSSRQQYSAVISMAIEGEPPEPGWTISFGKPIVSYQRPKTLTHARGAPRLAHRRHGAEADGSVFRAVGIRHFVQHCRFHAFAEDAQRGDEP